MKHCHSTILKMCDNREDAEALAIKRRIMSCSDLVAVGTYDKKCQDTFNLDSKSAQSIEQLENFNKLCEWLESEGQLHSLSELFDKMKELPKPSTIAYATKTYLKEILQLKYNFFLAEMNGKSDVVCFRNVANFIINDS